MMLLDEKIQSMHHTFYLIAQRTNENIIVQIQLFGLFVICGFIS